MIAAIENIADPFLRAESYRHRVLVEARSWIGTPFRHQADVRGERGGVDCVMFLIRVFHGAGLIDNVDPRPYPRGWFLRDNRYLDRIGLHGAAIVWSAAMDTDEPRGASPADVALLRVGRAPAHAAIVDDWPHVIHAHPQNGVERMNVLQNDIGALVHVVRHRLLDEAA